MLWFLKSDSSCLQMSLAMSRGDILLPLASSLPHWLCKLQRASDAIVSRK